MPAGPTWLSHWLRSISVRLVDPNAMTITALVSYHGYRFRFSFSRLPVFNPNLSYRQIRRHYREYDVEYVLR